MRYPSGGQLQRMVVAWKAQCLCIVLYCMYIHTYIHTLHTLHTYIHTLHTYIHTLHTYIHTLHTLHTYIALPSSGQQLLLNACQPLTTRQVTPGSVRRELLKEPRRSTVFGCASSLCESGTGRPRAETEERRSGKAGLFSKWVMFGSFFLEEVG